MPWHRFPDEPDAAWHAFQIYASMADPLDSNGLPRARTIAGAARLCGQHRSTFREWATRWDWRSRVDARDRHVAHQTESALIQARQDLARKHTNIAHRMLRIASAELDRLEELQADGDAPIKNVSDIIELIKQSVAIERLSAGAPNSISEERALSMTADLTKASLADLEALNRVVHATGVSVVSQGAAPRPATRPPRHKLPPVVDAPSE